MKVYIVIKRTSIEYEGSSDEIVDVCLYEETARQIVDENPDTHSFSGDTEHFYNTYNVNKDEMETNINEDE